MVATAENKEVVVSSRELDFPSTDKVFLLNDATKIKITLDSDSSSREINK